VCDHTKLQPNDAQTDEGFISLTGRHSPNLAAISVTMGGVPIANLAADSESGSRDSYSSFLVIIRLSLYLA